MGPVTRQRSATRAISLASNEKSLALTEWQETRAGSEECGLDARAAAVEAAVSSGEFESAAQVVDAALAALLGHDDTPDLDQLEHDIDEIEERARQGEMAMSATEALRSILAELKE
jgi:Arc/MetJ-type ribon-helix-helix transcriptional regulator